MAGVCKGSHQDMNEDMSEDISEDMYEDMYELQAPTLHHRRMAVAHRAKQFAPFAALKEHGMKIEETAEAVVKKVEEEEHRGFLYEDLLVYKEDELS